MVVEGLLVVVMGMVVVVVIRVVMVVKIGGSCGCCGVGCGDSSGGGYRGSSHHVGGGNWRWLVVAG